MTPTYRQELAVAATRIRRLVDGLPESSVDEVAEGWRVLLAAIEAAPNDRRRRKLIADYLEDTEARLTDRLLNAPLDWS